jgi:hypothetical protein
MGGGCRVFPFLCVLTHFFAAFRQKVACTTGLFSVGSTYAWNLSEPLLHFPNPELMMATRSNGLGPENLEFIHPKCVRATSFSRVIARAGSLSTCSTIEQVQLCLVRRSLQTGLFFHLFSILSHCRLSEIPPCETRK